MKFQHQVITDLTDAQHNFEQIGQLLNAPSSIVRASGDTTGASDQANINAAINALPAPNGGVIDLTDGAYYLPSGPGIVWSDRRVTIRGSGRGSNTPGTTVQVAAGGTAFNPQNGSGNGAGSRIESMRILGSDSGAGTNDGILLQCNSGVVSDVEIQGFGRHGLYIFSTGVGATNANDWRAENVRASSNYGSGIKAEGTDSNAGLATNLDLEFNHGEGIYENSAFGNTWVAPQCTGNLSHAIRLGAASQFARVIGAYKEGDANPALLIDSGNAGGNIVDFRVLVGNAGETIVDNSAAQDNRIISANGGSLHDHFPGSRILGSDGAWSTTTPAFYLNAGATKTSVATMAKVVTTNAAAFEGIAYSLGVLPAGVYAVGLYFRGAAGGEPLHFFAGLAAAGSKVDVNVTGTGYWARASGKFTADGATSCAIGLNTATATAVTFFVDDVQVTLA